MNKERKSEIIKEFAKGDGDVGSTPVQIALLTERVEELTNHMKAHPKDKHSERGLVMLVNKRRKLLKYYNRKDHSAYLDICKTLKIRIAK
ncbi:MAG: 30S ribosomal protein S15 [Lentisphaeria bacterium]|nr:30S ribosomal protein S15 [Lentisphaeria bacterium]NQZ66526.1 30S ribosomal protein S15 [Lentisphaeria bacterium]